MKTLWFVIPVFVLGCGGSVAEVAGERMPAKVEVQKTTQAKSQPKPNGKQQQKDEKKAVENATPNQGRNMAQVPDNSGAPSVPDAGEADTGVVAQAAAAAAAGDLQRADSILSSSGNDPVAKCNDAVVKYRLGKYADAAELARSAIEGLKKTDKCLNVLFSADVARHNYTELYNFLNRYASSHPKSITAANLAARVLIYQGKPSEAVRLAKNVLKRAETNIDVMKTIALGYMAMKRYETTKFVLTQIQDINKNDPDALDMMAHILLKTGKKRDAIPIFEEALKHNPNLYDARIQLGLLYMAAGDYTGARQQFEDAIKLMPGRVEGYLGLGTVLTKMVKFDAARKVFHKALQVSPDNPYAYFDLGIIELSDKPTGMDRPEHYRRAIKWFKKYQANAKYLSSNDPVYKYMDEAKRMAIQQEQLLKQLQQVPKTPPQPQQTPPQQKEPQNKQQNTTPPPAQNSGGSNQGNQGGKK